MDPKYLPFIETTEDNIAPNTPRVTLQIEAGQSSSELSLTQPYCIFWKLQRNQPDESDNGNPFIFQWSPYSNALEFGQLVLLHITDHGPERVDVKPICYAKPNPDAILVNGWNHFLHDLRPGQEIKMRQDLTANYQQFLQPGEKYELFWPGQAITMWDWGSMRDNVGKELTARKTSEGSDSLPVVLPASKSVIAFTAKQEDEPWPDRPETKNESEFSAANRREEEWRREQHRKRHPPPSPPPTLAAERVHGAPILSMELSCPLEWKPDQTIQLSLKVTYTNTEPEARPIIFHTEAFQSLHRSRTRYYSLIHHNNGSQTWKGLDPAWEGDGCSGFLLVDLPPVPVYIGDENDKNSSHFVSLRPGDSWTTDYQMQEKGGWTSLPEGLESGKDTKFKCVIEGAEVDWWDWGSKEDHKQKGTVVKLPCFISGQVEEPKDNGGRPKLVVPASNEVEFVYKG